MLVGKSPLGGVRKALGEVDAAITTLGKYNSELARTSELNTDVVNSAMQRTWFPDIIWRLDAGKAFEALEGAAKHARGRGDEAGAQAIDGVIEQLKSSATYLQGGDTAIQRAIQPDDIGNATRGLQAVRVKLRDIADARAAAGERSLELNLRQPAIYTGVAAGGVAVGYGVAKFTD